MKKILFLHGFFASGSCIPANALKKALEGRTQVLTPDLPMHPKKALEFIHQLCDKEKPDLLVGNSNGSFLAQIIAPIVGIPALLGNPHLEMTEFLKPRIGEHQYKAPRMDGKQNFVIDEDLIKEFEEVQQEQFNYSNPYWKDKIWGIFGEQDTLAHYKPVFLKYYNNVFNFPGGHTPTAEEVKTWYVPLIEKMLMTYEQPEERFFQHFKGGKYRFVKSVFYAGLTHEEMIEPSELELYLTDSKNTEGKTKERVVVYQALYGDHNYWLRPEKMFFEKVTRDGRTFSRFTEISNDL